MFTLSGELGIYSVLSLQDPSVFGKPFLPQSNHVFLLESSIIIPCLPWAQGWEQYVQDRPYKFLPQGLVIWSRRRGLAFGSQTLEKYEYKPLMSSPLPLGESLSALGENEVNTHKYTDPKDERQRARQEEIFSTCGFSYAQQLLWISQII